MECRGVCSAHVYHLCQFAGHRLSLQAYWTSLGLTVYNKKGIFCLNLSIITYVLEWKTYHRSFGLKICQ